MEAEDRRFEELTDEKKKLVLKLREAVSSDADENSELLDNAMCRRYLAGYSWSLEAAQSRLLKTLQWRKEENPGEWGCNWCQENPGRHSMRQIGFDRQGRAVLYTSFIQCAHNVFSAEESVRHMVFLMENCIRAMQHQHQVKLADKSGEAAVPPYAPERWVVILDCTGMTLSACNPRIASAVTSIIGDHYPERLGTVVTLNAGYLMRYAWSAIKVFLPATMAQKLIFINSEADYEKDIIQDIFDDDLRQWIRDEESLNRRSPHPEQQRLFWKRPPVEVMTEDTMACHDPRGTRLYVQQYLEKYDSTASIHQPHPNIIMDLQGTPTS